MAPTTCWSAMMPRPILKWSTSAARIGPGWDCEMARLRGRLGERCADSARAVRRSLDLDDDGPVDEAVEHRRGQGRIAEITRPGVESDVRDQDRRALVMAADEHRFRRLGELSRRCALGHGD